MTEQAVVTRQTDKVVSRQPRFTESASETFDAIVSWIKRGVNEWDDEPDYRTDSRRRDKWLREIWKLEPHWSSVINNLVLIDSSRGWTITGGRNQVRAYTDLLHYAENGAGWREFFRRAALSYYVTDIGSIIELGRDTYSDPSTGALAGPLRALYNTDSARCKWSGDPSYPLTFYPTTGKMQSWARDDFFNITSLPSDNERFRGLGWCATSRALELVKLLYGVLMYDQEEVGSGMLSGLLLLNGIDQTQWDEAMQARSADMSSKERKYFGGVFVLAGLGAGEEASASLTGLRNLPKGFDRKTFVDQTMYAYAAVAAVDPREIWPVTGNLGTATETETQHEKAASKGSIEFAHAFQEKLQNEFPDSLHFEFQERDARGELLEAEVAQAWTDVARSLYDGDSIMGMGLLTREQALSLLVDRGVIPPEYTEFEEDSVATDEETARMKRYRDRALDSPRVRRAIRLFPNEPIVQSVWSPMRLRERVLFSNGWEASRPRVWRGVTLRQDDSEILFADEDDDLVITEADVERAIDEWDRRMDEEYDGLLDAEEIE